MANNPYVNKVVYGGTTLVDLTDATATADKILEGYTAYGASGKKLTGTASGQSLLIVDTTDANGGTIRTITGKVVLLQTKTVTPTSSQQTINPDSGYDGFSQVIVEGATSGGSVTQDANGYIILPSTGGGGGGSTDTWSWMGKNPTKVATCLDDKVYLKDTGFATWTPSTTSSSVVSASNLTAQTVSADYEYIVLYKWHTHFEYDTIPQNKYITEYYQDTFYDVYMFRGSLTGMTSNIKTNRASASGSSRVGVFYVNNVGNEAYAGVSYGLYPSFSIGTVNTTTITPRTPSIYAKCDDSTYFSTSSAEAVDQDESYYEIIIELWRVDSGTSPYSATQDMLYDMWRDGF